MHVKARVVVVRRGTPGEHAAAAEFRIANSSGVMGHYLIDQIYVTQGVVAVGAGSARRQGARD